MFGINMLEISMSFRQDYSIDGKMTAFGSCAEEFCDFILGKALKKFK